MASQRLGCFGSWEVSSRSAGEEGSLSTHALGLLGQGMIGGAVLTAFLVFSLGRDDIARRFGGWNLNFRFDVADALSSATAKNIPH